MTQPTLEELKEQHDNSWELLGHSAVHSYSQEVLDHISEKHKKVSDAYYQTKYKKAFDLFGSLN